MEKIIIWAPLGFGAVIGWLSVYFIRKFKKYDEKILRKTVGIFLGGVGLDSIGFFIGTEYGVCGILYYLLGCSIGFFAHWFYQFVISLISRNGLSIKDYILLSSCNLSEEEEMKLMEEMIKANNVNQSVPSKTSYTKES